MINISEKTLKAIQSNEKLGEWQKLKGVVSNNPSYIDVELPIQSVKMLLQGRLNKSNMKMLDVQLRGRHNIMGQVFEYSRGLETRDGDFTIEYGSFRVIGEPEYEDDKNITTVKMYDMMVKSAVEVHKEDFDLTFPSTIGKVFQKVCDIIGVETGVTDFRGYNDPVIRDEWTNTAYTYRSILDHIAEVTALNIGIKEDKMAVWESKEIDVTISPFRTKEMQIGEKVGPFNILNITEEPQHYNNPYPPNWSEIPVDDRKEFVVVNNPIASANLEYYKKTIFERIKDIKYTTFDANTFGWGIFDIGDIINVEDFEGNKYKSLVLGEESEFYQMMLSQVYSVVPENAKEKYVVITDRQREGQKVYLTVDQQNGKIEAVVEKADENEDRINSLKIDLEGIEATVSNLNNNSNIIPNISGTLESIEQWTFEGGSFKLLDDMKLFEGGKLNQNFIPKEMIGSLSKWGLSFYTNGKAITQYGYVVPDEIYSLRAKRHSGEQPYLVNVLQYNKKKEFISSTSFDIGTERYGTLKILPNKETMFIKLEFVISGVSPNNRLELTELMFTRGKPTEWRESADDVKIFAESNFNIYDEKISLSNKRVDELAGDIHNTTVDISGQRGVEIWSDSGKGITVYNRDDEKTFYLDTDGNVVMEGNLKAGSVGDFVIDGAIKSKDGKFEVDPNNQLIRNGDVSMLSTTTTVPGYPTISSFTFENKKYPTYIFLRSDTNANFVMEGSGKSQTTMSASSNISSIVASNGSKGVSAGLSAVGNNSIVTLNGLGSGGTHSVARMGVIDGESKVEATNAYFVKTVDCSKLEVGSISGPGGEATFIRAYRMFVYDINATQDSSTIGFDKRFKSIYLTQQPNVSSDVRYKENLEVFDGSLDMLRNVNAYRFNMKGDDKSSHVGFKAQEVETHIYKTLYKRYLNEGLDKLSASRKANAKMDTIAMLNKDESYLSLLYGEIHTVLWQATKEIDKELQESNKRIEYLEKTVLQQQQQINDIIKLLGKEK